MSSREQGEVNLAAGEFPALLRRMVRELAVGRLEITGDGQTRLLWLDTGQVQGVISEVEEEKLGNWLVSRGVLEPHRMAIALLRQPVGIKLGAVLVQEGVLDLERLEKELAELATYIVSRMLAAEGSCRFRPGERLPAELAPLQMTTATLLVGAVRVLEGGGGVLSSILDPGKYLGGAQDALLRYQRVQLTPSEAFLLSRIDGNTTAAQLMRLVPLPKEEVSRALVALLVAGLVEQQDAPTTRAAARESVTLPSQPARETGLQFSPEQQREIEQIMRLAVECHHRDYYHRLSLNPAATLGQIHARFGEFSQLYHPDRAQEPHLRSLRADLAEIYASLAEAYETLSNPERRANYDAHLRSGPQDASEAVSVERRDRARREMVRANTERAQALLRAGDIGLAVQLFDQAVRLDPQGETLVALARLELRNPMWAQRALDHLRQAVTQAPELTAAWMELAGFWGRRGQLDKKRECLERILAYEPANEEAVRALNELSRK